MDFSFPLTSANIGSECGARERLSFCNSRHLLWILAGWPTFAWRRSWILVTKLSSRRFSKSFQGDDPLCSAVTCNGMIMIYTRHGRTADGTTMTVISHGVSGCDGLRTTAGETYLNPRISRLCQFISNHPSCPDFQPAWSNPSLIRFTFANLPYCHHFLFILVFFIST